MNQQLLDNNIILNINNPILKPKNNKCGFIFWFSCAVIITLGICFTIAYVLVKFIL